MEERSQQEWGGVLEGSRCGEARGVREGSMNS